MTSLSSFRLPFNVALHILEKPVDKLSKMSFSARLTFKDVDPFTRQRMQAVHGRDTEPELRIRRLLHSMGYRYRLHRKDLPGTPDIVFPARTKIIFVHGCFWHGHQHCKRAKLPTKNAEVWAEKIRKNRARDIRTIRALKGIGWDVLVIWECETRNVEKCASRLRDFLDTAF